MPNRIKTHHHLIIAAVLIGIILLSIIAVVIVINTTSSCQILQTSDSADSAIILDDESTTDVPDSTPIPNTDPAWTNCTLDYGNLMLINPNFPVTETFIASRQDHLISLSQTYNIPEYNYQGNGDNLMLPEAAAALAQMLTDYRAAFPDHEMGTLSCFRSRGTTCGRLCAATGTSDHHTGLTCDLIDLAYGSSLDTDHYASHPEWQWLKQNSYRYGFIDRFPLAWAGGPMSEPANVDASGSTGLYETWHYRYVGIEPATAIATGLYNNGEYDSLEHYLKSTGRISDLQNGLCSD